MSLDYSTPWYPRSFPASSVRCRVCDRPFQSGHVPPGDLVCLDCKTAEAQDHPHLFDVSRAPPRPPRQ